MAPASSISIFSIAQKSIATAGASRQARHGRPELDSPMNVLSTTSLKEREMGNLLYWALIFLIVAIIAGVLGFGGVAGTATSAASLLFWVAVILFVVSLVAGLVRRG
jgi:uncharacterized membrane protein YtjA (UPF0391 family)